MIGKSVLKKPLQKSTEVVEQQTNVSNIASVLSQLLGLLGCIDDSPLMAVLQKLLNALRDSNADLVTRLLLCFARYHRSLKKESVIVLVKRKSVSL